jgi:tRNA(fMet)-specific endonuclease VapC
MICLDTKVVISLINRGSSIVRARFDEQMAAAAELVLPVICLFEMRYGSAKSDRRAASDMQLERFLACGIHVAPFETEDAGHAGEIRAHLERLGTPIGYYDYLIAAQARRRGATLVTANSREFERVPGLIVTDWAA